MAGRGYGKTRTGAEWVREQIKTSPYVNLIGATLDDARDIMIEGESGILAICPKHERPLYIKRQLHWPNGAKSLVFTADEPERLRGKQHSGLWMDEIGSWRYQEAFDQAMFGLRLGKHPQAVITTTPRPIKILLDLVKDKGTHLTTGSSYENRLNLAPTFFSKLVGKYEGTRLGRQELNAELLEDIPGALWQRSNIDANRVKKHPDLIRIVVAIDPAVSTNEGSDETGIIAVGKGIDGQYYVLEDRSGTYTPNEWATQAIAMYKNLNADRIIGEVNNGGDMIESTIRNLDRNVSYRSVHASRGKVTRAEPIASLYEQNRVHPVGSLATLEDQMCIFTMDYDRKAAGYSPDRMDALVWGMTELGVETAPGQNIQEYWKQKEARSRQL
jgi:phage terminase large subunit-like protein